MTRCDVKQWIRLAAIAALAAAGTATAQTGDGSEAVLPLEAQTCNLPAAPASIPEEATYEDLVKAKGNVTAFQQAMEGYRGCLDKASGSDSLNDGNRVALTNAHNYSVEMEERVAEQFNAAVRAYKARQAEKDAN